MTEETELEEKNRQIERMNIELESLRAVCKFQSERFWKLNEAITKIWRLVSSPSSFDAK